MNRTAHATAADATDHPKPLLIERIVSIWIRPLVTAVLMLAFSFWVLIGIGWGVVEANLPTDALGVRHHLVADDTISVDIRGLVDRRALGRSDEQRVFVDGFAIEYEKRHAKSDSLSLVFAIDHVAKPTRCRVLDASGEETCSLEVKKAHRTLRLRLPLNGYHGSLRFACDEPTLRLRMIEHGVTEGDSGACVAMGLESEGEVRK